MRSILFILFLLASLPALSQDALFTQHRANPLLLNPALTGLIPGESDARMVLQYRDQWSDAFPGAGFRNMAAAFDSRLPLCLPGKNLFGLGALAHSEELVLGNTPPDIRFTHVGLTSGFHLSLDEKNGQFLSLGFGANFVQKRLLTDGLQFPSQFDGLGGHDSSIPVDQLFNENQVADNISFNAGIQYTGPSRGNPNRRDYPWGVVGISFHHINKPNLSLLGNADDADADMSMRFGVYGSFYYTNQGSNIFARFAQQGKGVWQVISGTEIKLPIDERGAKVLSLRPGLRLVSSEDDGLVLTDLFGGIQLDVQQFFGGVNVAYSVASYASAGTDQTLVSLELVLGARLNLFGGADCIECPYN